ncbi:T9SS type A sorting domain-containing protein [Hymenobacter elongatus]|uniref:T9SS type A sorting domain-containing protein n=1 Tax=Hymenobacter elongatus TaxID=877208 RepID=A0A4Z0PPN8_9BACT|nr:T9SS type A sorting domain-containing protein [Hymenobacter elongatus]
MPVITILTPDRRVAGSVGFTLTVTGTGFINGATVRFNGIDRLTTFTSATQVTATILAADVAATGTYPVTVLNPAPTAGSSAAVNFLVTPAPSGTACVTEGFEGSTLPPTGWLQTGVSFSTAPADVKFGATAATFSSFNASLTTTKLVRPTLLSFYLGRTNNISPKSFQVQVSTTNQTTSFTAVATIENENVVNGSYDLYSVDLSAYATSPQVWVRFVKISGTAAVWRLDDVAVYCQPAPEMNLKQGSTSLASGATFSFSNTGVGATTDATFTVENTGLLDLTLGNFTVTGEYSLVGPTPTLVAPGGSSTFVVRFEPQQGGIRTGSLSIVNNDEDENPYVLAFSSTGSVPAATYYTKATGNLNELATYGTNPDGSGTAPTDFSLLNQTYRVSGAGRTFTANWVVSGANSKVVLEPGASLVIPVNANFTGPLDLLTTSTLVVQHATPGYTLGMVDAASTIEFAQAGTYTVPELTTPGYGNLKLTNGTKTLAAGTILVRGSLTATGVTNLNGSMAGSTFTTVDLTGDFILLAGTTFPALADAATQRFTVRLNSNGAQTLTGNGRDFHLFRLTTLGTTTGSLSAAGGSSNLVVGNLLGGGGLALNTNTVLDLNGNNLTLVGFGNLGGTTGSSGTGLLRTTATSTVTINKNGGVALGALRLAANERLGALVLNATGSNNLLTIPSGTTVIGDLTLSEGTLSLSNNTLRIDGAVVTGNGVLQGSATSNLLLTGAGAIDKLAVASGAGSQFESLMLNRALNTLIPVSSTLTIGTLTLTRGSLLFTPATRAIATAVSGGGNDSFVNALTLRTAAATTTTLNFPLGGQAGFYRPLTLALTQSAASATSYTARQTDRAAGTSLIDRGVTAPLTRASRMRYFTVAAETGGATFQGGTLTLSFGADDAVTTLASLRLALSPGTSTPWTDATPDPGAPALTGTTTNGTVAAAIGATNLGDFALATTAADIAENPLPVTLVRFTATREPQAVAVSWVTASEKNSDYFDVQRSADGREFSTVYTMRGMGASSKSTAYSMKDTEPLPGMSYYRLRQVDQDGSFAYSPVRVVGGAAIAVYPNPVLDILTIQGLDTSTGSAHVVITDLTGRQLWSGPGLNGQVSMGWLQPGTYLLHIRQSGYHITQRIVRAN